MNIEEFREYCIAQKGVSEELPFGPDTLVYKVMGKIFALTNLNSEIFTVNLKCDPDTAIALREEHDYVLPGFHMNKKHWNTVNGENCPTKQLKELTNHSYDLVVVSFTKKQKEEFLLL
jgi:predicted DNA-binding protein (MmcQ/YjbR family)